MPHFDEGRFLDLVYSAAADSDLWVPAMEQLADALGGDKVTLARLDTATGTGSFVRARDSTAFEASFNAHFAKLNPFVAMPPGASDTSNGPQHVFTDEAWLPKADLVRTEYYNDFLRPRQSHWAMMIFLDTDPGHACAISIGRSETAGRFEQADISRAARLRPHINRAFRLSDKLAGAGVLTGQTDAALDLSPYGLFVLARSGRVLRTNRKADRLLSERASVCIRHGLLSAYEAASARKLNALIAIAASEDAAVRRGGSMILKGGSDGALMSVTVTPSRSETVEVFNNGPTVIVCISDLSAKPAISAPELQTLLGVTEAEARVAVAIMAGGTARAIAARLDLSFHTVRHHLQSLLDKTGVASKTELVALLTRAAAGLSR